VYGDNALAHRLVVELSEQYDATVVAVLGGGRGTHQTRIANALPERAVIRRGGTSEEALREAGIATARAVAFVASDDQANIHAALRSRAINPRIRVVIRLYNQRLGEHIARLIKDCTVLSASATAGPAFVNAALGRPQTARVDNRFLRIAIGKDIDPVKALCVVADRIDRSQPAGIRMLPDVAGATMRWIEQDVLRLPEQDGDRAMLQFFDGDATVAPAAPLSRLRWRLVDVLRYFTNAQLRMMLVGAVLMVVVSFVGIWFLARPFGWAVYESLLDLAGSAVPDVYGQVSATGGAWQRVFQVAITFSGILLIPVVTAIFLDHTASGAAPRTRGPSAGTRDHVVVVGLGNVGTRVATLLHGLGVPVVCVEQNPGVRGITAVTELGIPVLVGHRLVADALRAAHAQRSRAVVALTGDDIANLETALEARAIQPGIRVVVRLFDDDFAAHVYREFGNVASRSVSYLAAPAFAGAMMGQEVLATLSVYRKVLLIAEITVRQGTELVGQPMREIDAAGEIRVLALRRPGRDRVWQPADHGYPLAEGDQLIIAATSAGLGRLHNAATVT
jgi:Trk K+ transport system NAD-binding subunit